MCCLPFRILELWRSVYCAAPTATEKIVYVAVVFVMCGDSFRIVFGKKEEWEHRTSRMCVVVFAAGYAAAYAFGYHALLPLYIWELVAFLTLYFLVQGSFRTWHFVTNSKDTANMPFGQIRHVSTLLLFTFGLLSIGVMLLMAQIPIDLPWAELGKCPARCRRRDFHRGIMDICADC